MAYSAVSWAYKDVIASSKLAQMQENIRSHIFDGHPTLVGLATATADSALITAEAEIRTELRLPCTLKAARRYLVLSVARTTTDQANDSAALYVRDSGSAGVPTPASTLVAAWSAKMVATGGPGAAYLLAIGWLVNPAAGAHHLSAFGARTGGTGNITYTKGISPNMFVALLDVGSTTDYQP